MRTVLVLVPMKPNHNVQIANIMKSWLAGELYEWFASPMSKKFSIRVVFDTCGAGDEHVTCHEQRAAHIGTIRDMVLVNSGVLHDPDIHSVVWLDADLIRGTPGVLLEIIGQSITRDAIVAPMVMLEDKPIEGRGWVNPTVRFYDTKGFHYKGRCAVVHPPYFSNWHWPLPDYIEDMECVGCCYCVPAIVYQMMMDNRIPFRGIHFAANADQTEHYSVCQFARESMHLRVVLSTKFAVEHAYLPFYGERFH